MGKNLQKWWGSLSGFLRREGVKVRLETLGNLGLLFLFGLAVSLVLALNLDQLPQELSVGSVATKDIKADQNYEIIDTRSTQNLKDEATAGIRPVYDYDTKVLGEVTKKITDAFSGARQFLLQNISSAKAGDALNEDLEYRLRSEFQERMGGITTDEQYEFFRKYRFNVSIEKALVSISREILKNPIILNKSELEANLDKGFILRVPQDELVWNENLRTDMEGILSLEEAIDHFDALKIASIRELVHLEFLSAEHFSILKAVAQSLIKPNVSLNAVATEERKEKASGHVKNVIIKVKRGESIIRSGDRFEPWHLAVIDGIRNARLKSSRTVHFVGIFVFVNLILTIVYYYAARYIRKFRHNRKDLVFLGSTLLFFLILLRVSVFMASSIKDALPITVGINTLYYMIPIAGGAMLVRFILNSETALIFSVILGLLSGVFLENNLEITVYYLISGVFAAHAIAYVDKRSSVLYCGVLTGLVNAVTIYSINLISMSAYSESLAPMQLLLNAVSGFFGGIFTSIIVLALSSVVEGIFDYTTDIKLLELANLGHPLLKEMIWKAPGTYHHSQLVGILSEAGASAIGANPLFARVASFYHDIGKMKKPQYFIENQKGVNPHDKLAPSMSALIIEAHVKDGIDMAIEHKLPRKIIDIIPQHQGTKLIGYFFDKAKKMADPAMDKVDERDYRYAGPKPQTKEAGIIMLADTVEAAVRALPDKSLHKIQATVEKMLNQHFVDEQLDECDLTLRDLHQIANAFVKILSGIYHQRVEYPEPNAASPELHLIRDNAQEADAAPHFQRVPENTNIAPLFRKKASEGRAGPDE